MSLNRILMSASSVLLATAVYAATTSLSPGTYTAMLSPAIEEATADKIEKQLAKLGELTAVDVKPETSSLRFTVKDNASLDVAKLQSAVSKARKGIEISEPVMETSESPDAVNPGSANPAAPSAPGY